jgi:hypothetical protein
MSNVWWDEARLTTCMLWLGEFLTTCTIDERNHKLGK